MSDAKPVKTINELAVETFDILRSAGLADRLVVYHAKHNISGDSVLMLGLALGKDPRDNSLRVATLGRMFLDDSEVKLYTAQTQLLTAFEG